MAVIDLAIETGATQTQLTWMITAYGLVVAASLLAMGIAADKFSRRMFLLAGLAFLGGASAASAVPDEPTVVIVLRTVAGLGAAAVFPVTLAALVDGFPPERRAFAVSVWAAVFGAGATIGTLLAGARLNFAWWGSAQLAVGIAALALIAPSCAVVPNVRSARLSRDPPSALRPARSVGASFSVDQRTARSTTKSRTARSAKATFSQTVVIPPEQPSDSRQNEM